MIKVAYFDCFAGASGDMVLGSLIDAGLAISELDSALKGLRLDGYELSARREKRGPIAGTRVVVEVSEKGHRRTLGDIERIVNEATLPEPVKTRAVQTFRRLGEAEARIHGIPVDQVHFHEVGAVDAIVDIVGAFAGLHLLGIEEVHCSPFPAAGGTVQSSHGTLPLPAPATLALLAEAGAPVRPAPVEAGELVTPTAAAILTTAAVGFRQPEMSLRAVGYGVGTRDHPQLPNVLRLWIGESINAPGPTGEVHLLETNIDDMNPEFYGFISELLFQQRALDVWCTSIQMKKGRPGTLLSVLARPLDAAGLANILLQHTSTLGVRVHELRRWEAERETVEVRTDLGTATVKVKRWEGRIRHIAPEYESCAALARQHGIPLAEVYRTVEAAAWAHQQG